LTDNVVFSSVQRILASVQRFMGTRSRTGTLRDDRRGARPGRLYGMKVLQVILTMLPVRISAPREKATDHRTRSVPIFARSVQRFFDRDPVLILSEDGGPLTDNVVFSSVQRILASVQRFMGTRSRTGSLRDDRRGARPGRLYGMKVLQVILTMLPVRIPLPCVIGT